jgi:hypothetical protein
MARFTVLSRTVLFHVGSSWRAKNRAADGMASMASGSLCPHHTAIDGWWPSRSTIASAWRAACLRMPRA